MMKKSELPINFCTRTLPTTDTLTCPSLMRHPSGMTQQAVDGLWLNSFLGLRGLPPVREQSRLFCPFSLTEKQTTLTPPRSTTREFVFNHLNLFSMYFCSSMDSICPHNSTQLYKERVPQGPQRKGVCLHCVHGYAPAFIRSNQKIFKVRWQKHTHRSATASTSV